ncbi:MAG: type 2 isopentenyl-diphosphate Delta-isomerase [Eubacteriales bacterium]
MSRLTRKDEHIITALRLSERPAGPGFNDITLVHNALPEVSGKDVSLRTELFGKWLQAPLAINAITGGGIVPGKINEALAIAARETGLAMAVGSQTVAVDNPECAESFSIARKMNPTGLIMANIGAHVCVETALKSIEMISADALQIHLNVPQEAVMREGDRDFRGWLSNISKIVKEVQVPVIVKEVGFGLSWEVAKRLNEVGVKNFDVGGRGGTNFISIEDLRSRRNQNYLESWGIITPVSLIEIDNSGIASTIMATGGIRNGLHAAKALALGAKAAGIAGICLKVLFEQKVEGLIRGLENLKNDLKKVIMMTGVENPSLLQTVPVVITGRTREWLAERGIDTTVYARRGMLQQKR